MTLVSQSQSPAKARPITRAPFLFPSVLKPLKRDVHPDQQPDPEDSALVTSALAGLGHGAKNLFSSIKDFQAAQGLKTDGWLRPGGPTYQTLNAAVAGGLGAAVPAGKDRESWLSDHVLPSDLIGFDERRGLAARNKAEDLFKFKRGAALLLPNSFGGLFEEELDDFAKTRQQIKAIQEAHGLEPNGWMGPGSETQQAYQGQIESMISGLAKGGGARLAKDPEALWRRLQGERHKDKPLTQSLFPPRYVNLREALQLGETRAKNREALEAQLDRNAHHDHLKRTEEAFETERRRIAQENQALGRARREGDSDRNEERKPEAAPEKPLPEVSDTLTPVPEVDSEAAEPHEEPKDNGDVGPWSLEMVDTIDVDDDALMPAFISAVKEKEVGEKNPILTSFQYDPNGLPEIGLGIPAMLWDDETNQYVLRRNEFGIAAGNIADADWTALEEYGKTLTVWRNDLLNGKEKAAAGLEALARISLGEEQTEALDGLLALVTPLSDGVGLRTDFPEETNQSYLDSAALLDQVAMSNELSDADQESLSALSSYLKSAGWNVRARANAASPPDTTFYTKWDAAQAEKFVFDFLRAGDYEESVVDGIGDDLYQRLSASQRAELLTMAWLRPGHFEDTAGPKIRQAALDDLRRQAEAAEAGELLVCAWEATHRAIVENAYKPKKYNDGYVNRAKATAKGFSGCELE